MKIISYESKGWYRILGMRLDVSLCHQKIYNKKEEERVNLATLLVVLHCSPNVIYV